MIRVEDLVKNYGEVEAVRSISFDVNDGEILGFLGANGAGKTTTLRVIAGYLAPTSGTVRVNDLNIHDHSLQIRQQIGYLPEMNPLYGEMKVYDLLKFTAKIRRIEAKSFKQALERVVDQCGLSGVVHRPISDCSKGYRQRVGLAAAMIHNPEILLLDEPVTGLDPNQIVEIRELIKQLGREKMVMISSHILQEIEATVDRIIIINEGSIVADGTSQELMSSFRGKTRLTMEVKKASEKSLQELGTKVGDITVTDISPKDGRHILSLEYDKDKDPREDIFLYARKCRWIILEMSPHHAQLEDIFRTLTVEEVARA